MKNFVLIFTLFAIAAGAQTNRFIYEYQYIPNINEKDTIRKEMMVLDVSKNGSRYYSHDRYVQDSIMKADFDKQISMGSNNFKMNRNERLGKINYQVLKSYPDFKTFLISSIGQDKYKILEDEKLTWKILPETQKIGEYEAQKATASFGGRAWIAWFSPNIPFQDGPYKFHGLPGLIVKAEDATASHIMILVANKKIEGKGFDTEIKAPGMTAGIFDRKEIEVDEKKFKKIWQDYLNDPAKGMREMMMKNSAEHQVVVRMKTSDGRELTNMNEIYRNMESRVKEAEAKNNNKIEPSLFSK
ncbi:MAG: GLPGLI family protein [Weeksellaceae bacterium]|nr:GLPGLI family protein [Weeksellaceae bacterium]